MQDIIVSKIKDKIRVDDEQIKNCSAEEINFQDEKGNSPLSLAINARKIKLSLRLLKHPSININLKNRHDSTPLIKSLCLREVAFVIFKKNSLIQSIEKENLYNFLVKAVEKNSWMILENIFNKIPFHILNDSEILSILISIILKGKWDLAEKVFTKISFTIIDDPAIIDLLDYLLETEKYEMLKSAVKKLSPEAFCFAENYYIIFRILMKKKCDILDLIINKLSSLKLAQCSIEHNMFPLLQFLIFIGNNEFAAKLINRIEPNHLNFREEGYKYSPLDVAILNQNLFIFHKLIRRLPNKALYEQNEQFGYSPLHLAVLKENLIICQSLIDKLPIKELSTEDKVYEYTPLHLAMQLKNLELIAMFNFSKINLDLEISSFNKINLPNNLPDEEICDLLNIAKINNSYFYFDFNKLMYEINPKRWNDIKIILKEIENSINYLNDDEIFTMFQQIIKINSKTIDGLILNLERILAEISIESSINEIKNNESINRTNINKLINEVGINQSSDEIKLIIANLKEIQYFQLETRNKSRIFELAQANKITEGDNSLFLTDFCATDINSYSMNKISSIKKKDISPYAYNNKVFEFENNKILCQWNINEFIWKSDLEKIEKLVAWNIRTFFYEILIGGKYYPAIIIGKHKNDKQKYLILPANWEQTYVSNKNYEVVTSSIFLNFRWAYGKPYATFDSFTFMWVKEEQIIGFYTTNQKMWMDRKIRVALHLKRELLEELEIKYFLF